MRSLREALALAGIALASLIGSAALLLLVVFLYVGSFHVVPLALDPPAALAWNALLSALFFLQHSGMVRRSFRARLGRIVGEPFHGLVYTTASGITLMLCLALWQRVGEPLVLLEGASAWPLRALFLLAIAGSAWGAGALGSIDTFGAGPILAHLRGVEPRQPPLAIKGPYRWVRHPLYFFSIVLFWSCPVLTPDRLLFNVLWTTWVVLATRLEERDLVAQFGSSYVRYQGEVPMIVPWRIPARR